MAKILIIDDDGDVRQTLANLIRLGGYEPLAPPSSQAAVREIKSGLYDLVITDMAMPDVDGLEIIKLVREFKPECPIIAISGGTRNLPSNMTLHMSEQLGANVSLKKPVAKQDLYATIATLLTPKKTLD